jgi:alpha-L-fucosidase
MKLLLTPVIATSLLLALVCRGQTTAPAATAAAADSTTAAAPSASREQRLQWWRDAKFGLFVHWGPASVSGKEISWSRIGRWSKQLGHPSTPPEVYDQLYKHFNPTKFDADAWMKMARGAGMKYVVFVCKHHDGFAMWDTKLSDYSITHSPYGRDICRQIADAAHRQGLRLGWYYSTWDWTHPDYLKGDNAKYNDYYEGQVRELLSNYGKVDVLWFDHVAGNWSDYRFPELFKLIHDLQPDILVNDRAAKFVGKPADRPTPDVAALVKGDFSTPERRIGKFQTTRAWETCIPITDISKGKGGGGWSYRPGERTRSYEECLAMLVNCVTGDGNLLLNVGPLPTGEIDPKQVEVLGRMGAWLEQFGQSIYATRGGPYRNGAWGGSTYRDRTVYVHVLRWPAGDALRLPPLPARIVSAKALSGAVTEVQQDESGVSVSVAPEGRDAVDTVVALTLDRPARGIAPIDVPSTPR